MANLSQYPRPTDSVLRRFHTYRDKRQCKMITIILSGKNCYKKIEKKEHVYSPFPNKALELLLSRQLEIEWLQPLAKNACLYDNKNIMLEKMRRWCTIKTNLAKPVSILVRKTCDCVTQQQVLATRLYFSKQKLTQMKAIWVGNISLSLFSLSLALSPHPRQRHFHILTSE